MIAIVASSDLAPTPQLIAVLAGLVASAPQDEWFAIRVNSKDVPTSPTERLVLQITKAVGRNTVKFAPAGERDAFRRDYYMVERSRQVVAFFPPGKEMTGGTGHVVKAALDRDIPVEAYTIDGDGDLIMIGSDLGNPNRVHTGSRPDVLRKLEGTNV